MSFLSNRRAVTTEPVQRLTFTETIVIHGQPASAVGDRGRRLFTEFRLWRRANHPRSERLYWHALKPIAAAALILWFAPRYALAVRRRFGVPVSEQIAALCRLGFIEWVNPRCYYFHEHYRRRGTVDCSAYVMRHEFKEGLLRSLHKLRPKVHGARTNLGHKLAFAEIADRFGLPTPKIGAIVQGGRIAIRDRAALSGDLFVKPEQGRGAVGAEAFRRRADGKFAIGDDTFTLSDLLQSLASGAKRQPKLVQVLLRNHPQLADLAGKALVTIRIITVISPEEQPLVTHAMLRTISKLEPDWPGSEEYAAPIDIVSGRLGLMCGDTAIGPQHWYQRHPVTGAAVTGRIVPQWPAIRELAIHAHRVFADRMIVGWDIALTPEGPVLLEGNSYPDTEFLQRVHRQAIGDSPLGAPLAHQLDRLEALRGGFRAAASGAP